MTWRAIVLVAMLGLSGCGDDSGAAVPPAPLEPGADASGHFCGMSLLEHAGPKGQVHLRGRAEPLWFTSVRDTLAFALLPDEPWPIDAIFVNDMGRPTL